MEHSTQPKKFAFVLMPFSEEFNDVYQLAIKPACESTGCYCERVDDQVFDGSIVDRIYNQIAKADLIIADMSTKNPNVFYETGYAHALGKRVILLTRDVSDIPFDLKHYFHITYREGIAALKQHLTSRLKYYQEHNPSSDILPFDNLDVTVNGHTLPYTNHILGVPARIRLETVMDCAGWYTQFDIGLFLRQQPIDSELDILVRLITPPEFYESSRQIGPSSIERYSTLTLQDQNIMHKPLSQAHVSQFDPDKITFRLLCRSGTTALDPTDRFEMTLRLISNGLSRDYHFYPIFDT